MKYFAALLLSAVLFVACGDDDSSSFVEPEKESSDSGATLSGDSHEGSSPSSCSSKDDKSSSSVSSSSTNSSSSAKSSSSTDAKSSSSVTSSSSGASSSSMKACTEEGHMIQRTNSKTNERDWYVCQDGFYVPYIESSSSSVPTSSYFDMDSLYNSTKSYGEFKDPRDGQTYKTIVVAPGWVSLQEFEVFAQNLNYGTQVKLGFLEFDDSRVEKFCYDDDPWYCDNGFGGLYSWSEAMGLPKACDSVWTGTTPACPDSLYPGVAYDAEWDDLIHQGVCPDGWHVMNRTEYFSLRGEFDSGYRLLSKICEGSNYHGFSALYGGGAFYEEDSFHYDFIMNAKLHRGLFWVPHDKQPLLGGAVILADGYVEHGMTTGAYPKYDGLSVRCVKNY
ncbi:FISUMP domain-containing protein [Fibrobacter sp. UWB1]|uniref:FISUMP domain-containing protein n=1 Tax=Fibrobacter sp. UWB1 TaxID=1964355 RepID=UPI00114005D7|nr:FISUMP domain-containing protein [Fibrobacter sp. UWB1]